MVRMRAGYWNVIATDDDRVLPISVWKGQFTRHPVREFDPGDPRRKKTAGNLKPAAVGEAERGLAGRSLHVRGLEEWRDNLRATLATRLLIKTFYSSNERCRVAFHHTSKRQQALARTVREVVNREDGGTYACVYLGANYDGGQAKSYCTAGAPVNKTLRREMVGPPSRATPGVDSVRARVRVCVRVCVCVC